jgi:DNA polymerase-3 subunit epsilon
MTDFASIDFETANGYRTSICNAGLVIVRKEQIIEKIYRLIRPEPDYYCWQFTEIHGLTAADTENEPVFPFVWREIASKIAGLPLVAHNAYKKSATSFEQLKL